VVNYPLNLALLLEMPDCHPCQTTVYFETFDEDALADESESGDFFYDAVVCWFIECNSVHGLVLDFSF
jgi:hypothetical protein